MRLANIVFLNDLDYLRPPKKLPRLRFFQIFHIPKSFAQAISIQQQRQIKPTAYAPIVGTYIKTKRHHRGVPLRPRYRR